MNAAGLPLARFQEWMQAVVVHRGGADAGLRSRTARRIVPPAEVGGVVRAHGALTPVERLRIYASMYPLRTVEALRSDYPALATLLGEERLGAFVAEYVATHPSTSFTLARLGDRLPAFAAAWGPARGRRLRADVARLERAAAAVFDAADVELLDVSTLASALASEGESLRLVAAPAFALLAVRPGAVAVLDAFLEDASLPASAGRGLAHVALFRRDFAVLRRALDPVPGRLLAALVSGFPLGEALARAARGGRRLPARAVSGWLAEEVEEFDRREEVGGAREVGASRRQEGDDHRRRERGGGEAREEPGEEERAAGELDARHERRLQLRGRDAEAREVLDDARQVVQLPPPRLDEDRAERDARGGGREPGEGGRGAEDERASGEKAADHRISFPIRCRGERAGFGRTRGPCLIAS